MEPVASERDDALIVPAPALVERVEALGRALRARGWHLATAESCTGGLLAGACTAPAGASDWFEAGIVSYANAAKTALLDVPEAILAAHGAVSAETAGAMALGALARTGVDLAVAVTGIAGPGGGSVAKPVGTVWLGFAWRDPAGVAPRCGTERLALSGDRAAIRSRTVAIALDRLVRIAVQGGLD
ncbi:MAG TPA: nicotinamide-nucleotide amidohydrolase family protein [Burkholderiaceae bacterium]|nr:nicotinamide-nucleotide amidohydrolase family protein [Burkholderiaceae bacterium]